MRINIQTTTYSWKEFLCCFIEVQLPPQNPRRLRWLLSHIIELPTMISKEHEVKYASSQTHIVFYLHTVQYQYGAHLHGLSTPSSSATYTTWCRKELKVEFTDWRYLPYILWSRKAFFHRTILIFYLRGVEWVHGLFLFPLVLGKM